MPTAGPVNVSYSLDNRIKLVLITGFVVFYSKENMDRKLLTETLKI